MQEVYYLIDGYNLLFRLVSPSENLQKSRETLITELNQKISLLGLEVSIVFDAAFQEESVVSQSHYDHLEIFFTARGESADDYILEVLKNEPSPEKKIIVTSDKKLAWRSRNSGAKTESVEDFLSRLNRAYKKKLRQQQQKNQKKQEPAIGSAQASRQASISTGSVIPKKNIPLEGSSDYYLQVFEKEWEEIAQKEKTRTEANPSALENKSKSRKQKKQTDPFALPPTPEEKAATEMDRWLKIFEGKSKRQY